MPDVAAPELQRFATGIFTAAGFDVVDASVVAEVLVWANLRGVDGHGVQRIPRYMELIDEGNLNPRAVIRVAMETPAAVMIDADRGPGPVAMILAAREAIRKAKEAGVGLALIRRTTHTAALGYYTRLVAEAGMAAIAGGASIPNMIYHGTKRANVSTSPFSLAVPGGAGAPLVLDMATSVASLGKIAQARRAGKPIPPDWALDAAGNPTTDAAKADFPLPLGGPKGSGMAFMFECIASLITGNPILADAFTGTGQGAGHRQNAFLIAIDVARFGDLALFRDNVGRLVGLLKAMDLASDAKEVLMPGERGDAVYAQRSAGSIPIPPATWKDLGEVAARFRLAMPATV
jgi:ureidoglycolate dehydrogenase (NAD+)